MKFTTTSKKGEPRWWKDRKLFLERFQAVKDYIYLTELDSDERERVIEEYEQYLRDTRKSEAYKIYQTCLGHLKSGRLQDLKDLSLIARQMRKNGDYEKPKLGFDPKNILHFNQDVRDYKDVCNKVDDFEGKGFSKDVMKALL